MSDLRPATREELLHCVSHALRFNRSGKSTSRNSELMAQFAAEALADMLDRSGFVIMKRPPAPIRPGPASRAPGSVSDEI